MHDPEEGLDKDFEDMSTSESGSKRQGRLHQFYEKRVKPAFPEAITDLKILSGVTALETRVKRDINDPQLFPEILKVAEVRRGLELCPEVR